MLIENCLTFSRLDFIHIDNQIKITFCWTKESSDNLKIIRGLTNLAILKKIRIVRLDLTEVTAFKTSKPFTIYIEAYFQYDCTLDELLAVKDV